MGLGELVFCVAVLAVGDFVAGYNIETLRTLAFVTLVCGNQATTYNNRERRRIWSSRPSWWLIASSVRRHVDRLHTRRGGDCDGASALAVWSRARSAARSSSLF